MQRNTCGGAAADLADEVNIFMAMAAANRSLRLPQTVGMRV